MIRTKTRCRCGVAKRVKATNVSAIIHKGALLGVSELESNDPRRKLQTLDYEAIEFCGNPTCERVFKAERKEAA